MGALIYLLLYNAYAAKGLKTAICNKDDTQCSEVFYLKFQYTNSFSLTFLTSSTQALSLNNS